MRSSTTTLHPYFKKALQAVREDHFNPFELREARIAMMQLGMTHPFLNATTIDRFQSGAAEPNRFAVTENRSMALVSLFTATRD